MTDRIALIIDGDRFEVRRMDAAGNQNTISGSSDLAECLSFASKMVGYPLVIPISGPATML